MYKSIKQQLFEERKKRRLAESKLIKAIADLDYIAMMSDIAIETTDETEELSDE